MKTNEISRKLIKPSIPTPQNLKSYKISYLDEIAPGINIGILLFYSSKPEGISQKLQESLRKILPQFYVLAGRYIMNDQSIDCSDQGAEFIEAEAPDHGLADIIGKADHLNDLLPRPSYQADGASDPLLSVKITSLNGGVFVIGLSLSHRISDTASMATFLAAWSKAEEITITPNFDQSPVLFPGRNLITTFSEPRTEDPGIICQRLCFNKETIDSLRSKLRPSDGKPGISKVLVVSAVIAEALVGLDRVRSRDYYINHAVNMRGRTVPPLHGHAYGNLALQALSRCITAAEVTEVGIQELVDMMSDAIGECISECAAVTSFDVDSVMKPIVDLGPKLVRDEVCVAWFSDWSKFGFYEADFGWGKPVWVGAAPMDEPGVTLLMGNRDGDGIEAWVHLHKDDMMKLLEQIVSHSGISYFHLGL